MNRISVLYFFIAIFIVGCSEKREVYHHPSGIYYSIDKNQMFHDSMIVKSKGRDFILKWRNGVLQGIMYSGEKYNYDFIAKYPNKGPYEKKQYFYKKNSDLVVQLFESKHLNFFRDNLIVKAEIKSVEKQSTIRLYNAVYGAFHFALMSREEGFNLNEDSLVFNFYPHENQDSIWFQVDYNLESPEKAIFKFPITDKTTKYIAKYNDDEALVFKDNELSWDSLKVLLSPKNLIE